MKFKVIRDIRVRVIDYVDADNLTEAKEAVNDLTSLTAEISMFGMRDRHTCVMYDNYTETIE